MSDALGGSVTNPPQHPPLATTRASAEKRGPCVEKSTSMWHAPAFVGPTRYFVHPRDGPRSRHDAFTPAHATPLGVTSITEFARSSGTRT